MPKWRADNVEPDRVDEIAVDVWRAFDDRRTTDQSQTTEPYKPRVIEEMVEGSDDEVVELRPPNMYTDAVMVNTADEYAVLIKETYRRAFCHAGHSYNSPLPGIHSREMMNRDRAHELFESGAVKEAPGLKVRVGFVYSQAATPPQGAVEQIQFAPVVDLSGRVQRGKLKKVVEVVKQKLSK